MRELKASKKARERYENLSEKEKKQKAKIWQWTYGTFFEEEKE